MYNNIQLISQRNFRTTWNFEKFLTPHVSTIISSLQNRTLSLRNHFIQNITRQTVRLFKECQAEKSNGDFDLTTALPTEPPDESCTISFIRESVERMLLNELSWYEAKTTKQEPPHKNSTNSTDLRDWTLANSILYATTVITTIGESCELNFSKGCDLKEYYRTYMIADFDSSQRNLQTLPSSLILGYHIIIIFTRNDSKFNHMLIPKF